MDEDVAIAFAASKALDSASFTDRNRCFARETATMSNCNKESKSGSREVWTSSRFRSGESNKLNNNNNNNRLTASGEQVSGVDSGAGCNNSIGKQTSSSYSKIFQYLPSSLNLNGANSNKFEKRKGFGLRAELRSQNCSEQSSLAVSKTLASALSRFRISSASTVASTTSQKSRAKNCEDSNQLIGFSSSQRPTTTQRRLGKGEEEEPIGQLQSKVKRKGFLYLKRSEQQVFEEPSKANSKRRDLNNNSIANILSSSNSAASNQQNLRGEEDARLLDFEDEQDMASQELLERNTKGSKMLRPQPVGQRKHEQARVPLVGCLLTLGLLALLSTGFKLTLALQTNNNIQSQQQQQQQSQQPFSRSQPLQAAALPSGSGGGQSPSGSRPLPQLAAGSLVANVNCNKIRGHVTLTPNQQGGATVSTQISAGPPDEVYQWSIHQFPVKPGAAMCSCSPLILGAKLIDLSEMHGNLPSDQEFSVQTSLSLFGLDSPVGHSLMLRGMKTGMVACATFLPTSRKSNYRAKFHTPLSGSVTIFQTAFGTSFISHLMYSNGTRRHSLHRFELITRNDDDLLASTFPLSGSIAATPPVGGAQRAESMALEQREHDNELNQCKGLQGEPILRNSSYQLAVSTENFGMRGRTALVLPQIPFETFASVYLVVYSEYDPFEPLACAPLKFVKPKTAAAKFQSVSVQGSVVFSQDSPYDVTLARINLNMPNSDGHSYGIDELPMIIRRKSDTRVCPNIRETIYNPHHVEPSSVPAEGEATSDQYAVGDLSGKYGSLTGKANEKIQVQDYNLPLFGPVSVVGRAMTVYSAEGVAIACSNIELTTPMTTAFATFDFGIQGQFIFRQPVNDCNGDTYVYIEVSKPTGASNGQTLSSNQLLANDNSRSLDHNWHIHVNPVDSGLDHLSTTDCLPAGGHFNPYNTSTSSIYNRDCTPFNVLRCELGDLSSKMFTLEIPPYRVKGGQEPDIGKFFGTDIDLPLCGPVSIVNRSVVVHVQDFGMQRLACSTVIEFKPRSS